MASPYGAKPPRGFPTVAAPTVSGFCGGITTRQTQPLVLAATIPEATGVGLAVRVLPVAEATHMFSSPIPPPTRLSATGDAEAAKVSATGAAAPAGGFAPAHGAATRHDEGERVPKAGVEGGAVGEGDAPRPGNRRRQKQRQRSKTAKQAAAELKRLQAEWTLQDEDVEEDGEEPEEEEEEQKQQQLQPLPQQLPKQQAVGAAGASHFQPYAAGKAAAAKSTAAGRSRGAGSCPPAVAVTESPDSSWDRLRWELQAGLADVLKDKLAPVQEQHVQVRARSEGAASWLALPPGLVGDPAFAAAPKDSAEVAAVDYGDLARRVREAAAEQLATAWATLHQEFSVQCLIWDSIPVMNAAGEWSVPLGGQSLKPNQLRSVMTETLARAAAGEGHGLEAALRLDGEEENRPEGSLNKTTRAAVQDVLKAQRAPAHRRVVEILEALEVAGDRAVIAVPQEELKALVVSCALKDRACRHQLRQALGLPDAPTPPRATPAPTESGSSAQAYPIASSGRTCAIGRSAPSASGGSCASGMSRRRPARSRSRGSLASSSGASSTGYISNCSSGSVKSILSIRRRSKHQHY